MSDLGKENRYKVWLVDLDRWCLKHKITRKQAVGLLLENDPDDIQASELCSWNEWVDFALRLERDI